MNQKCKGAYDLLPEDMERFRYIEDAFRSSCINWGYQEIKTPTLEYLHLFTSAGTLTPNMLNKVYSFLDWDGWSGERVVLRPDGTIPVARLYIENLLDKQISRLFYVTNVFAFEETGKENRERWQCGIELLNGSKHTSDVEMIMLGIEILRNLRVDDVEIRISHAGVLKALIKDLKLSSEKEVSVLNELREGNWKVLETVKTTKPGLKNVMDMLLNLKSGSGALLDNIKSIKNVSGELDAALDNFIQITRLLDTLGCKYIIDITSAGGFEYYTGICFNFMSGGKRIGGGGRYDDLVPLIGGASTPACGFSLYIEPLMKLVKENAKRNLQNGVLIYSSSSGKDTVKACFDLAESLRKIGYVAELEFGKHETNFRWIVSTARGKQEFTVTDRFNDSTKKSSSIKSVLDIIGGL
jgi:histidyl-tRNA synthetase